MVFAVNAIKILLYPWYPRSLEVKTIYYKNSQIKNENKLKNPFKFVKRIPKIKFLKKETEDVDNFIKNCQKTVFENRERIHRSFVVDKNAVYAQVKLF